MVSSITEANGVTMPTTHIAISGTATMVLSEGLHSNDFQGSDLERSEFMDMVSSLASEELIPDCLIPLYEPDYWDSCAVRIVGCSGDGIYQAEWVTTTSNCGSTGLSVMEVGL